MNKLQVNVVDDHRFASLSPSSIAITTTSPQTPKSLLVSTPDRRENALKRWYNSGPYYSMSLGLTFLAFAICYCQTVLNGPKSWISHTRKFRVKFALCWVFIAVELILLLDLMMRIIVFRTSFFYKHYRTTRSSKTVTILMGIQVSHLLDCFIIIGDCILSTFCLVMIFKGLYGVPTRFGNMKVSMGSWCHYQDLDPKQNLKNCVLDFWFSAFGILLAARMILFVARSERMTVALKSLKNTFFSIVAVFIFLFSMLYVFAIVTFLIYNPVFNSTTCSNPLIVGDVDPQHNFCRVKYGNILRALGTMFQVVSGDAWISDVAVTSGEISRVFSSTVTLAIFIVIFVITNLFLLNVITGIVVDAVINSTDPTGARRSARLPPQSIDPSQISDISLNDTIVYSRLPTADVSERILKSLEAIQFSLENMNTRIQRLEKNIKSNTNA
jgi:hypothetical protein